MSVEGRGFSDGGCTLEPPRLRENPGRCAQGFRGVRGFVDPHLGRGFLGLRWAVNEPLWVRLVGGGKCRVATLESLRCAAMVHVGRGGAIPLRRPSSEPSEVCSRPGSALRPSLRHRPRRAGVRRGRSRRGVPTGHRHPRGCGGYLPPDPRCSRTGPPARPLLHRHHHLTLNTPAARSAPTEYRTAARPE